MTKIIDRIGKHPPPKYYRCQRRIERITGIVLHQTGCAKSDRPESWDRLNAHYGTTPGGHIVLANAPKDFIWHAQGLSPSTVGVEIAGNYPGFENEPSSLWKKGGPAAELTGDMIEAAHELLDIILNDCPHIRHIYAHRQSYQNRANDPGYEIWQQIAIPWREFLDCPDSDLDKTWGKKKKGWKIPPEWRTK